MGINAVAMNLDVYNDLPVEMKRAMAKQAEAERERRAKATHADGELESASTLAEAAKILSTDPTSIQLRSATP